LLDGSTSTPALTAALQADAGTYTWAAAAVGSNTASGYQLASGEPIMAIGGFNGSDPTPTLAEFQAMVAAGKIHYFIGGGGFGGRGGSSGTSSQITSWVTSTFTPTTIGGTTVYDLTTA
jgi:4-amino-4-deoxy-L-arabinose transferase-like glycosyltransferase